MLLITVPSFACTRSMVGTPKLTEEAIRLEITKIGLQTRVPDELIARQPDTQRETRPTAIEIIPMLWTDTPEPTQEETPVLALEIIQTATSSPVPSRTPTPRNTYPVELINPEGTVMVPTPEPITFGTEIPDQTIIIPTLPIFVNLPQPTLVPTSLPDLESLTTERLLYVTQNGDTLQNISTRFGVNPESISSMFPLPASGFLNSNVTLFIGQTEQRIYDSGVKILPDEYIVYAGTAANYDLRHEIEQAGGFLSSYEEQTSDGTMSGKDIVYKICRDYSVNPIVLLTLLEYKSHWVYGAPKTAAERDYPMGWIDSASKGLYKQLGWAADTLSRGYYGWRLGTLSQIPFYRYPRPPQTVYFDPTLNAGSIAIQYLFSQIYSWDTMDAAIYGEDGFTAAFESMFGDVWENYTPDAHGLNADLQQIPMTLPFSSNEKWALTGGPHAAWSAGSPFAALDFAPPSAYHGCAASDRWVLSTTPGVVTRVGKGIVIVDTDGDGLEETGWVLLYLHIGTEGKIEPGTVVEQGTRIGHPSCEGGNATGTHVHIARKYNGEWMAAAGPLPFVLSGWVPYNGAKEYLGGMTRGDQEVQASTVSSGESIVTY